MNQNAQYLLQVGLCVITLASIVIALTKKPLRRPMRMLAALCPIIYGAIWYLKFEELGGLFAMLMGFVAMVLVFLHPRSDKEEDLEEQEEKEVPQP